MSFKLKTEQQHRWGTKRILPIVGEVEVSSTGEIEVATKEEALALESADCGFFCVNPTVDTTIVSKVSTEKVVVATPEVTLVDETLKSETETVTSPEVPVTETTNTTETPDTLEPQVTEEGDLSSSSKETLEPQVKEEGDLQKADETKTTEVDEEQVKSMKDTLLTLKVDELQKLAESFPKAEWKDLKKDQLIAYLLEKLN